MTSPRWFPAAAGTCVVLLTLLAMAGSAFAAPTWSPPEAVRMGDTQAESFPPAVAYGQSGRLTVAWTTAIGADPVLPTARRFPGGPFESGPPLAAADGATEPALARGPGGELYAAWVVGEAGGDGIVMAARLGSDGGAVSPQRLSAAGENASEPAIAVGADGRVAVAWTTTDSNDRGEVRAIHRALGGAALTPLVVSEGDADADQPDVAFGPGGVLHVAWRRVDTADRGRIKAAAEKPDETFDTPRLITAAAANASDPALAAVPDPGLAFSWTETDADENTTVRVGIEPAPNQPLVVTTVAGGADASGPHLATDLAGVLYVAWIRTSSETQAEVLLSARNGAGGLDAPQVLSAGDQASELDLAFSPGGDAVVAWRRNLGTVDDPAGDIRGALYDAPRAPNPAPLPLPTPAPTPTQPAPLPSLGLSGLGVNPRCIRYGAPLVGTRRRLGFTFALSEPATIVLAIQRRLNSRPQRRCPVRRAVGEAGRFGPPIVVQLPAVAGPGEVPVGGVGQAVDGRTRSGSRQRVILRRALPAGRRRVVVRQSSTALVPGTYVATLVAKTTDGRMAHAGHVKFWVLSAAKPEESK